MKLLKLLFIVGIVMVICGSAYARGPIRISGNGTSPLGLYDWNTANGVSDGDGTEGDPFIIEKLTIDARGYTYGLWIEDSTHFFEVKSVEVYGSSAIGTGKGIFIDNCDHATLYDVYSHHNDIGLMLQSLSGAYVSRSDFNSNTNYGISMYLVTSSTVYWSQLLFNSTAAVDLNYAGTSSANGNYFSLVTASFNRVGFALNESDYNEFDDCSITDSTRNGMEMLSSHHNTFIDTLFEDSADGGVVMYTSDYNEFDECVVYNNGYREGYEASTHGFFLDHSSYNEIWDCTIEDNNEYAVYIDDDDSDGNRIFHNNVTGNNDGGTQGYDGGSAGSNDWHDDTVPGYCEIGNYWGGCAWGYVWCYYFIGSFCNADYQIDGPANSEDEGPSPTAYSF